MSRARPDLPFTGRAVGPAMRRLRPPASLVGLLLPALWLLVWAFICAQGWIAPVFLPSPQATAAALVEGLVQGDWLGLLGDTLLHMAVGWALASLLGVALGALIGLSARARAWLQPSLEFVRPLPASAIVPVAIAFFGLTQGMILVVVVFGSIWPVMLATVQAFASLEPRLLEVSRVLRLSRPAFVWKIGLPAALPDILAGMQLSVSVALVLAVIGEMLASQQGLGAAVLAAARSYRAAELYAGVILISLIGYGSGALLGLAESRLLRWQPRT